jgi:Tfp pilus assembly protein PilN
VKAVNLIPREAGLGRRAAGGGIPQLRPVYGVLALLAAALALVTVYVLTGNTIAERQAKIQTLQGEVAQAQAQAASLARYSQFSTLVSQRVQTVREIAGARFDWHAALSDLSKVVPADTSLQSLTATVAPGQTVSGGGSAGTSGLRSASQGPAFELTGCTRTQDDVARLMSRLRLINGVTRVTLGDTQKPTAAAGASTLSSGASAAGTATGCGANAPTFDLVVFFAPIPGAAALSSAPAAGSTPVATSSPPSSATTTTPATTSTTSTPPPASQPVSSTTTTGGAP